MAKLGISAIQRWADSDRGANVFVLDLVFAVDLLYDQFGIGIHVKFVRSGRKPRTGAP